MIEFDHLVLGINFNDTEGFGKNIIEKRALDLENFDSDVWNMLFRVEQVTCKRILIGNNIITYNKVIPTKVMQLLMDNGYININQIEIYAKKYQMNNDNILRYLFRRTDFKRTNISEKRDSQELGENLKPKKKRM